MAATPASWRGARRPASNTSRPPERATVKTFSIDTENRMSLLTAEDTREPTPEGAERFQTERQLASLTASWPASRLIAIWNQLPGVQPVKRFTDRKTAIQRIWKVVQGMGPAEAELPAGSGRKTGKSARHQVPKQGSKPSRANTKVATVIALLEGPSGASLKAIMGATGWQAHSVRGFISGQLGKRLGLRVKSFERDGERVYAIRQ